ncbi:MAG: cobalamin-dependent protein [Spirochaetes bacterium]|nr:cobalamin-dependent protein [Spirochaetota bacterium]MBU0955541.1 cobalamin-dependent protein [Spirochaetota bacterium]
MFEYQEIELLDDILAGNLDGAVAKLRKEAERSGYPELIHGLVEPVLRRAGEMWGESKISLAQSYVAGKVTELLLDEYLKSGSAPVGDGSRGVIIMGNIEDDFHVLGRRMVIAFLRLHGWQVVDLGNDVPAADFVDAAVRHGACIIGVSAMMLTTALNIKAVRVELDRRNLGDSIKLAVGGAIFRLRPDLVQELGADGTADSAMEAPQLMERLAEGLSKKPAAAPAG